MSLDPNCIFCRIVERKIPSTIIYEDDIVIAFNDVHPQAPFHALIIPKTHIPSIQSITDQNRVLVGHLFFVAKTIAEETGLVEKGYRMVINNGRGAGQTVFHLHLHILSGRPFSWPPG